MEGGREIRKEEGEVVATQGLAESYTPSLASKWYNSSAGSRRANESHGPSRKSQRSGRIATEGGRGREEHLPADMRLDRELRMEQGMEKRIGLLEVVECCLAGFVQGQAQIWRDVVDRIAVREEDSGQSKRFFPTRQTEGEACFRWWDVTRKGPAKGAGIGQNSDPQR